ncbi:hypothetical protein GCM10028805_65800 [Spirosoma harenae]
MKLTPIRYAQYSAHSGGLRVVHLPELDTQPFACSGFLAINSNTAYVDLSTYKRFDKADIAERNDVLQRLVQVANFGTIRTIAGRTFLLSREFTAKNNPAHLAGCLWNLIHSIHKNLTYLRIRKRFGLVK